MKALYIHVPFCRKICPYCHFIRTIPEQTTEKLYLEGIRKEIKWLKEKDLLYETLYFGGGTPSYSMEILRILIDELFCNLKFKLKEFTVEVNPEDCSYEFLKFLKSSGVSRVSVGIQSINEKELEILGRVHTKKDVLRCAELLKEFDFEKINFDFIFGIPESKKGEIYSNLEFIFESSPDSVSYYMLEGVRGKYWKNLRFPSDGELKEAYELIKRELQKSGFLRYEVSNFSKPGFESIHNLKYWKMEEYIGVGPSAVSFFSMRITKNRESLYMWERFSGDERKFKEVEKLDKEKLFNYILIMGLRLEEGINVEKVFKRTGIDVLEYIKEKIPEYEKFFKFDDESKNLSIKNEYFFILNEVLSYL